MILIELENRSEQRLAARPGGYHEAVREQFAGVPGCAWDTREKNYVGGAEVIRAVCKRLVDAGVAKLEDAPVEAMHRAAVATPPGTDGLRQYQRDGVHALLAIAHATGAAFLGDEMGLGKSAQALACMRAHAVGDLLIVCPAIVVPHWRAQLARWAPELAATAVVLSYERLTMAVKRAQSKAVLSAKVHMDAQAFAQLLSGCAIRGGVIFDEIHYVSNPKSQRAQACGFVRQATKGALVLGLSGTPITTRVRNLWGPLDLLWPGRWGSKFAFEKRYCDGHHEELPHIDKAVWVADGATELEELHDRLTPLMVRRAKADVLTELPARTRETLLVPLPVAARKALRQIAADMNVSPGHERVSHLLGSIEGYKIATAVELASEQVDGGRRPLILTTRKQTARAIATALQCPLADGDTAVAKRRSTLLGAADSLLPAVSTVYAVTTGIDLVEFDSIIFVGLDWVPANLLQAEARIDRMGQKRPVLITYLIGEGTLDEIVKERVISRLDATARALEGGQSAASLAGDLAGDSAEDLLQALVNSLKGEQ